jgi:hypothetical protein
MDSRRKRVSADSEEYSSIKRIKEWVDEDFLAFLSQIANVADDTNVNDFDIKERSAHVKFFVAENCWDLFDGIISIAPSLDDIVVNHYHTGLLNFSSKQSFNMNE